MRGITAAPHRGWSARPTAAWLAGAAVRIGPIIVGLAASLGVALWLPEPTTTPAVLLWWTAVAATPLVAVVALERATRRVAPLPFLLRLSLTFPDEAPSRLQVLRETHRTSSLVGQLREEDPDAVDPLPTAASILALITALQRHDRFTRGHSERVRLYADLLGEELDLSEADRQRLRWAALLHDVGKLRVDGDILNKDSRPDDDEWAQLRRHPDLGVRLAGPVVPWLGDWAGAISDHHEHHDGTGYPDGKRGDDISLGGRIVAVADAYETMTAGRPYRQALGRHEARDELVACAGTQFDPQVVRAFLNLSLPRAPWPVAIVAWLAEIPLLARLRAMPQGTSQGVVAAAGVTAMAATGLVTPTPSAPPEDPAPVVAQAERHRDPPDRRTEAGSTPDGSGPQTASGGDRGVGPEDGSGDRSPSGRSETGGRPPGGQDTAGTGGDGVPDGSDGPGGEDRGDRPGASDAEPDVEPTADDRSTRDDGGGGDDEAAPHQIGREDSTVTTALYLHAAASPSPRYDVLPMTSGAPSRHELGDYDTDIDDQPGLRLRPTDLGRAETRLDRRQRWAVARDTLVAEAALRLELWVRPAAGAAPPQLSAFIDRCGAPSDVSALRGCRPIADGTTTGGGDGTGWQQVTIRFDALPDADLDAGVLVLTVTAGPGSGGDVLVAFDTVDHPSALRAVTLQPPARRHD